MSRKYIVLRSHPDNERIFETIYQVFDKLETEHNMLFEFTGTEELNYDLVNHSYEEKSGRARLLIINDWRIETQYLMIEAPEKGVAGQIEIALRQVISHYTLPELQQLAEKRLKAEPEILVRMAFGVSEDSDERSFTIISGAAASEDDLVRFRAAEAAAVTGWPSFGPVFRPLMAEDASPEVREMAAHAVAAAERTGPFSASKV